MSVYKNPALGFLKQAIENIVSLTGVASASTTLSNGQSATFTITTTPNSGELALVIHDWTIYIGSAAVGNQLPDGGNITSSQWIVIPYVNDWGATNNINAVAKIYVENVSAGSNQTVILYEQGRLIQNSVTGGAST